MEGTITTRARSLRNAASLLEVTAIVCSIAGVIAGAMIAAHVRYAANEPGLTTAKTHPHFAAGIAVIIAAVLLGVLSWCAARAIGLFAVDVAARHGSDLTAPVTSRLPEFLRRSPVRS